MWWRHVLLLSAGLMVVAACDRASSPPQTPVSAAEDSTSTTVDRAFTETTVPPPADLSIHGVPLEEIYFDTFDGGAVPLSESTPELRRRLLDAIPPIDDPVYGDAAAGDWLGPDDPVLGYVAGSQAYAYPFKILNYHEIVNDIIDDVPVLISYCPLCRSAIVYHRRVDGQTLSFGNTSALYESDMVMVDRQTGSYWWQVAGEAIVGPLTGSEMALLPSSVATWQDWRDEHPDTLVLTRETGYTRPYERDPFVDYPAYLDSGRFPFPVSDAVRDDRLSPSALVLGVSIGGETRAYPIEDLTEPVNDVLGGEPLVILPTQGGAAAFSALVEGESLVFGSEDGAIIDTGTGSRWSSSGMAISGPLAGSSLEPLPSRTTFWFALVGAFPETDVHG